ncbi:MAG: NADH dehydrogenase subunit [Candidatus Syntrophonatronum acetioxidans]|uniref:NADH dehydrogenase subunit n=1 Tax=Candidatus Syntrophonatronum acetioxidans TaxID=1795816 RepID=A0A424YAR4_9FIRM|nr:MAG: NADH dehydrogenase subunit [Candidatus Syntrophonatronum acetioxidans]
MYLAAEELQQMSQVIISNKPVLIVLIPIIGSLLVYLLGRNSDIIRNGLSAIIAAYTFKEVLSLYPLVQQGIVEYRYSLQPVIDYALYFKVDNISFVFAVLMSFIWLLATVFSWAYMSHEHAKTRFFSFFLVTLGACLGVVLTGDLIALFLFFELMTFSSYVLVIHEEDRKSMDAGNLFLVLSIIGGLIVLFAIFLLYFGIGTTEIRPLLAEIEAAGLNQPLIISLFLIGFGIKAGMVPLHIWLPLAHPIAPAPASALLSGLMIKVGAYGIWRVVLMIFTRAEFVEGAAQVMEWSNIFGFIIIWIGVITMFLGAFMAIQQTMAKTILAYSSVSQMGYILMGIGCAAYMGAEGVYGFTGALYHIINHALFKAGLFMMVGAIYIHTHELDIEKVRGMAKKLPFIAGTFLVAAFGIGGIPGFNGYTSKTLVHHAIEAAYQFNMDPSLFWAEKIFTLTSALTVCYFIKLFRGLFLGEVTEKYDKDYKPALSVKLTMGIFAACIIFIGTFPQAIYQSLVIPAMNGFTLDPYKVEYVTKLNFFVWPDIRAILIVLVLVAVIYPLGTRQNLFKLKFPPWLSIEYSFYRVIANVGWQLCLFSQRYIDSGVNRSYEFASKFLRKSVDMTTTFEDKLMRFYSGGSVFSRRSVDLTAQLEDRMMKFYEGSDDIPGKAREYDEKYKRSRVIGWNIKNINIAALLMALMISLFLIVFFYYAYLR